MCALSENDLSALKDYHSSFENFAPSKSNGGASIEHTFEKRTPIIRLWEASGRKAWFIDILSKKLTILWQKKQQKNPKTNKQTPAPTS